MSDPALTTLNGAQLPASFLLLVLADRLVGRNWPLVAIGVIAAFAAVALAFSTSAIDALILSGVIGFCAAAILILVLALPPLLAESNQVHRFSAGVFMIGYTISFFTPIISGALWDATHAPASAFMPVAAAGAVLALLAATLHVAPRNEKSEH